MSDVAKKISIKNKNNIIKNVICNSAQIGLIPQIDFFDKEIANDDNTENYFIIEKGDFVYNPRKSLSAPYGPVNIYTYEEKGIVSPLYLCFKINNINHSFLNYYFKSNAWYRYIYLNGDSGARHDRVSIKGSVFFDQKIYYPAICEQEKIGDMFTKIDSRITAQSKIIEEYESLINRIRKTIFSKLNCEWEKLNNLIEKGFISLYRGNIIPKHEKDNTHIYPVYSSSVQKDGLMGYSDNFMFDEELITWSIDGGGDIFYRHKHKFSVTNVCGIMKIDTHYYNYRFVSEILKDEHSRMVFDYQTKAHPSVINQLYSLPQISIEEQLRISKIFDCLYSKLAVEKELLKKLKEQKKYLLSNMFI